MTEREKYQQELDELEAKANGAFVAKQIRNQPLETPPINEKPRR